MLFLLIMVASFGTVEVSCYRICFCKFKYVTIARLKAQETRAQYNWSMMMICSQTAVILPGELQGSVLSATLSLLYINDLLLLKPYLTESYVTDARANSK